MRSREGRRHVVGGSEFVCVSWRRRSVGMICMRMSEDCATFCSCFCSTIWRGYRRALEYTDLWNLNDEDRASYVGAKFEREWQKEVKRAK